MLLLPFKKWQFIFSKALRSASKLHDCSQQGALSIYFSFLCQKLPFFSQIVGIIWNAMEEERQSQRTSAAGKLPPKERGEEMFPGIPHCAGPAAVSHCSTQVQDCNDAALTQATCPKKPSWLWTNPPWLCVSSRKFSSLYAAGSTAPKSPEQVQSCFSPSPSSATKCSDGASCTLLALVSFASFHSVLPPGEAARCFPQKNARAHSDIPCFFILRLLVQRFGKGTNSHGDSAAAGLAQCSQCAPRGTPSSSLPC